MYFIKTANGFDPKNIKRNFVLEFFNIVTSSLGLIYSLILIINV